MALARQIELHHVRGELEWLELGVRGPALPAGLRVEVAPSHDLLRCSAGASALWARLDPYCQGVTILSTLAPESPGILPPWPFAEVREASTDAAWLHRVAEALLESPRSPLSRGTFGVARTTLEHGAHAANRDCHVEPAWGLDDPGFFPQPVPEHFNWEGSFGVVLPLRQRPADDEGRLKAWRKAAREGWLPPLVLFFCTGLNAWLLLDGHLRLRAAQLEGLTPRVLLVWRLIEEVQVNDAWTATMTRRYEYAGKRWSEISLENRLHLNEQLIDCYAATRHRPRSVAAVRPGLRALFEREAAPVLSSR